jgi:hypothetical protein
MEIKMKIRNGFGGENVVTSYPPFVKYPSIAEDCPQIWGQKGYVFEKVDGSLSQVRNTSMGLVGGSKSNYLIGNRISFSTWFSEYLAWMRKNESLHALPKNVIMFGEWLVPRSIEYDPKKINKFYFIDLAFISDGKPVIYDYDEARDYLKAWGVQDVQVLDPIAKNVIFDPESIKHTKNNCRSVLREGDIEGVILKDYRNQQFAKCLNDAYSEIRTQEKDLESQYINPPRIKKALVRLEEDYGVKAPSLDQLALQVARDVKKESGFSFDLQAVKGVIRAREYYHRK